jgi:hypothetical protein
MIFEIRYKKLLIITILFFSGLFAQSQLRNDGYYSATIISKTGDTSFHIIYFTSHGSWTDTGGVGVAPSLINAPVGRNNERCIYSRHGNELTLTSEPINLPQYHVSNCPCKYRIRIEDDRIFVIDWRDNNKNRRIIKEKYLFELFRNNN